MGQNFRDRFLEQAGLHPYAWAAELGLPKDLVTAVVRGKVDYQPIRRTLEKLSRATGKSVEWWLNGEDKGMEDHSPKASPLDTPPPARPTVSAAVVAGSSKIDPELLEIAAGAVRKWEETRRIKIAENRRSAVIAVLYNNLIEAETEGGDAMSTALESLG